MLFIRDITLRNIENGGVSKVDLKEQLTGRCAPEPLNHKLTWPRQKLALGAN